MSARKGICNAALEAYQAGQGRAKRPIGGIYGPYSTGWRHHEKKRAAGRVFRLAGKSLAAVTVAATLAILTVPWWF